ncbi:N-acetyltransferase activity protein [Halocaridina rubra]|uniref:N-acetyltransferase activity protein n=1 Tax=Halocaridina rubra TaxID=373956 RepID=A0AAN8X9F6_HALRR
MGMTEANNEDETKLVVLHRYPEYADDCMEILNSKWPRSRGLRLRSLRSSCDNFPTSLALLRRLAKSNNYEVIGHARVNVLPREEDSAWIESVIIRSDLRGKGYGRILMTKTEEFSRTCGFTMAYLSTHDQQKFYSNLGYEFCPPVCIFGGSVNRHIIPKQFLLPSASHDEKLRIDRVNGLCKSLNANCTLTNENAVSCNSNVSGHPQCTTPSVSNPPPLRPQSLSPSTPPPPPPPLPSLAPPPSLGPFPLLLHHHLHLLLLLALPLVPFPLLLPHLHPPK